MFGLGIDDEVSYRIEDLATPEDFWTHRDDLGSVTSLTDINGAVVERYEYGDYGDVRIFDAAGVALAASSYNIHHLYTGRTVIPGTGLMDYRWRVMDPKTGRFIQPDPVGTFDDINLYQVVHSNPFALTDPFGLGPSTGPLPWDPEPSGQPVWDPKWQLPSNYPDLKKAPGFRPDLPFVIGNCNGVEIAYNLGPIPEVKPNPQPNRGPAPQPWWRKKPYGIFHPGGQPAVAFEWTSYECDKFCRKRYAGNSKNLMTCYTICMAAGTDDSYMYALMTGTTTLRELYEFFKDN